MCGRFTQFMTEAEMRSYYQAEVKMALAPSYNVTPSSEIAVLVEYDKQRLIVPMRWGLIPSWSKPHQKLPIMINAKSETIHEKPSFRRCFQKRRCLIIANGFYEWDAHQQPKQPYYVHAKDNQPLAFAGIWDKWRDEEDDNKTIISCAILTTQANSVIEELHERMPVVLTSANYDVWLDNQTDDLKPVKALLSHSSTLQPLTFHAVSFDVNKPSNNHENLIQAIE